MMLWRSRDDEGLQALSQVAELSGLPRRELRRLLTQFDRVAVDPGTVVARAGRPCVELLVVVSGELHAVGMDGSRTLGAGTSWGWAAMAGRRPNSATVVAASGATVLVMGRAQFRAVCHLWRPVEEAAGRASVPA